MSALARGSLLAALLMLAACGPQDRSSPELARAAGRSIYRDGVLPSGERLRATLRGDAELVGAKAACASCHGRSGLGFPEGQVLPPAISGPILFAPRVIERRELYASRLEGPGTRPAYTDESLARAIREGIDAKGARLEPPMPHYPLGDADLAALIDYLHTLGASNSPGVTEDEIHLATVVTPGVAPERRDAMVAVLSAFVEAKNGETRHEGRRKRSRGKIPFEKDQKAYRRWTLDTWELSGPEGSFRAQLEARYRERPVFALLSGIGAGSWEPVQDFCEEKELPCILPNTDLPGAKAGRFYTLYFSEGLPLEARVLARHLRASGASPRILQVHGAGQASLAAAEAFGTALGPERQDGLRTLSVGGTSGALWERIRAEPPELLLLWLDDRELQGIDSLAPVPPGLHGIYLSSTLVEKPFTSIPPSLRPLVRLVHPFGLPEQQASRLRPAWSWLRSRGVAIRDERVQANTYFAAHAFGEALMHMVGNFSRDYLMEKLEHRLASPPWAAVYAVVGLGAGQRFLSKGAYVVCLEDDPEPRLVAVTEWIVP
jgi:mono/diheme cytochrome c family protein